jgi:hypothetical protein
MNVYVVLTRDQDYYAQPEIYSIFSTEEKAEEKKKELEVLKSNYPYHEDELEFAEVLVE